MINTWILAQHADRDIKNQKNFLEEARRIDINTFFDREKEKEIFISNLAMLEDRIKVNSGEEQEYGSQFWVNPKNNNFEPRLIRDIELKNNEELRRLNERRNGIFMEPLEEYLKKFD